VNASGITTIISRIRPLSIRASSRSSSDGDQGLSFKSVRPRPV
jgi:hypothetical protein